MNIFALFGMVIVGVHLQGNPRLEDLSADVAGLVEAWKMGFHMSPYPRFIFVATLAKIALPNLFKFMNHQTHRIRDQVIKL